MGASWKCTPHPPHCGMAECPQHVSGDSFPSRSFPVFVFLRLFDFFFYSKMLHFLFRFLFLNRKSYITVIVFVLKKSFCKENSDPQRGYYKEGKL